jgi:hypothetical protein
VPFPFLKILLAINEGRASGHFTQKVPENQPYIFFPN